MREYKFTDNFGGVMVVKCKNDKDCLFCKNCSDIFYDYTNGPYMVICRLDKDTHQNNCDSFEEAYDDND